MLLSSSRLLLLRYRQHCYCYCCCLSINRRCPGGTPGSVFDPNAPGTLSPAEGSIKLCPNGTFTAVVGATNIAQCSESPRGGCSWGSCFDAYIQTYPTALPL